MVLDKEAVAYLREKQGSSGPELAQRWAELDRLYSARLWHELTVELLNFVKLPELQQNRQLIELYEKFIQEFQHRMQPLQLVELCAVIVQQCHDTGEAIRFMEHVENQVLKDRLRLDPLALVYSKIIRGNILLKSGEDVKNLVEEVDEFFKQMDGITKIHGLFYSLQSQYYSKIQNLTGYYRNALKYLGCVDVRTLPHEEQKQHAVMLATSALVADDMFSFGELIAHPVLNSLKRQSQEWLVDMLKAMNEGNVRTIDKLKSRWSTDSVLRSHENELKTKAILLAIVEMAFKRPAAERQLSFEELENATGVPRGIVELYVMKAFSKGILAGKIDGVDQKVYVSWVLPRVLNTDQIHGMVGRMDKWQNDIGKAQKLVIEKEKGFEDLIEEMQEF